MVVVAVSPPALCRAERRTVANRGSRRSVLAVGSVRSVCSSASAASGAASATGLSLGGVRNRRRGVRSGLVCRAAMDGVPDGSAPPLSARPEPKPASPNEGPPPNPPLRVAAFLAATGSLESSYLAFEKLTGQGCVDNAQCLHSLTTFYV